MKTILAVFLTILLLLPVSAIGEIITVTHTVKQTFGGGQSPDDARISGIALAKREALEKAQPLLGKNGTRQRWRNKTNLITWLESL